MKRLKRVLRLVALIAAMLVAASGAGVFGAILPGNTRNKYEDVPVKIEMVDKEDEREEEQEIKDVE